MKKMGKGSFGKFALGAALGVGIGLLVAPREGKETRKALKEKIDDLLCKAKDLDKEEVKKEIEAKVAKLKKEISELDKEKVLEIAKEKGEKVKEEAQKLVDLAKEKGTPVLEKTASEVREKAIVVTKNVLEKLESSKK